MKLLAALFCVVSCLGAVFYRPQQGMPVRLIILGNHQGNLSPCGCSSPMLGGILREAEVVRSLQKLGPNIVLDSGNMSGGNSRQEILKAQTLSETLGSLGTLAVNLSLKDSKLGSPELLSLQESLLKGALISGSVTNSNLSIEPYKEAGGFLVGGVSEAAPEMARRIGGSAIPLNSTIDRLLNEAAGKGLKTLLLLDGDRGQAVEVAQAHPSLDLIVFNSTSEPSPDPLKIGTTTLVSPGERGEYLLDLEYSEKGLETYHPVKLGEEVHDDPQAGRFYKTYLARVEEEKLWEELPRPSGKAFAGSEACSGCHAQDYKIWKASDHSHALYTLSSRGHGKDPECLRCHVTGAEFKTGFRSLQTTPHLAFVGCESCHGSAVDHVTNPYRFHLPKVQDTKCKGCHEALNSPLFNFATYWPRIRHGFGEKGWKALHLE